MTTTSPMPERLVVYPFPLRGDVFAELRLPADLTPDEAERMAAFIKTLAVEPPQEEP